MQSMPQTFQMQSDIITKLKDLINADFEKAIEVNVASNGRLVILGTKRPIELSIY